MSSDARPAAGLRQHPGREPLNRERVLRAAVAVADAGGIGALSMRRLADDLGVVPMALYKHVANKEELLDGMVEMVIADIGPPATHADWRSAVRDRILTARRTLLRHPWCPAPIESRTHAPPVALEYMDSLMGMFLAGGFGPDLTHHVMHALGSRMWGFTQEVFPTPRMPDDHAARAAVVERAAATYPHIAVIAMAGAHDADTPVGRTGCDDQAEFEFALDLLLDGFERLLRRE